MDGYNQKGKIYQYKQNFSKPKKYDLRITDKLQLIAKNSI